MRLGAYDCWVQKNTRAFDVYKKEKISERHRHRYELNNEFRAELEKNGLVVSGVNRAAAGVELVEMIEIKNHPWFLACQFHPEFKSKPLNPHPLFVEFVKACLQK